jgi:hypothetical protein
LGIAGNKKAAMMAASFCGLFPPAALSSGLGCFVCAVVFTVFTLGHGWHIERAKPDKA